jgi:hypothetical protein
MKNMVPIFFGLHLFVLLSLAFARIMHYDTSPNFLYISLASFAAFLAVAIREIVQSTHVPWGRRKMWIAWLVLTGTLGGLMYVTIERKRWQKQMINNV